jgi:arsenate reductase
MEKELFLCYPKCTTCQKAQKWLEAHNIRYDWCDIKQSNPTYEELVGWLKLSGLPVKKLFNTSGLQYKALNLKDKLPIMSEDECLRLLSTDGMLVKRPLLTGDGFVLVGFKESEWEQRLNM